MQLAGCPGEGEDGHQVKNYESGERGENSDQEWQREFAEDVEHRNFDAFLAAERFAEDRRFGDGQADVEAEEDESGAGQEGKAPAEGEELVVAELLGEDQEHASGKKKTCRRAELRKHSIPGAFTRRGIFDGEQDRAAPFASQTQTLTEAAEGEEQRRGQADFAVGGQQADGDGGDAHGEQGGDQGGFAADAVAEMTEQRGAERPGDEGDGESGQRGEGGRGGIFLRKEEARKNQDRGGGV